jgi:sugar lactone lactonase YvrE
MHHRLRVGALLAGPVALLALGASAQAAGPPTVVADHLNNPRGLTFGPGGSLYIAQAGRSGNLCVSKGECGGFTGAIAKLSPTGVRTRRAAGLLSVGAQDGTFVTGADDVAVDARHRVFTVVTSLGAKPPKGVPAAALRQAGRVIRVTARGGLVPGAAVDRIEFRKDPDGQGKDSDPYGIAVRGGKRYVTDAAGNDLLEVSRGKVKVVAVFPDAAKGAQSVPTVVRTGPDHALYVGELSGDKAPNGASRVWRVVPGHKPTVFASGFSRITGLAFGPDRSLYVTEFSLNFAKQDPAGDVVKVAKDGTRTRIGTGSLFFPAGVAVARNGSVYVSNWSVLPGKAATKGPFKGHNGQVVRFAP